MFLVLFRVKHQILIQGLGSFTRAGKGWAHSFSGEHIWALALLETSQMVFWLGLKHQNAAPFDSLTGGQHSGRSPEVCQTHLGGHAPQPSITSEKLSGTCSLRPLSPWKAKGRSKFGPSPFAGLAPGFIYLVGDWVVFSTALLWLKT